MYVIYPENLKNFSFTQNIEYCCTPDYQYLKIHKNGCSHVLKHIEENFIQNWKPRLIKTNNLPSWTVIRDPYDRFISGLAYDIKRNHPNFKDFNSFFSSIDISKLFLGKIDQQSRAKGNIVHTYLQITYLYNQNIDVFVDLKDLDLFLNIHFKHHTSNKNSGSKEFKSELDQYIQSNNMLKQIINSYLAIDYYILKNIYYNATLWTWQNGKIF